MTSNFSTQESLRKTRHRRPHRMKNEEGCWGEVAMMTSIIMIHLRATPRSDHCLQSQWEISISLMTLLLLNLLSNSSIMPSLHRYRGHQEIQQDQLQPHCWDRGSRILLRATICGTTAGLAVYSQSDFRYLHITLVLIWRKYLSDPLVFLQ